MSNSLRIYPVTPTIRHPSCSEPWLSATPLRSEYASRSRPCCKQHRAWLHSPARSSTITSYRANSSSRRRSTRQMRSSWSELSETAACGPDRRAGGQPGIRRARDLGAPGELTASSHEPSFYGAAPVGQRIRGNPLVGRGAGGAHLRRQRRPVSTAWRWVADSGCCNALRARPAAACGVTAAPAVRSVAARSGIGPDERGMVTVMWRCSARCRLGS